MGRTQGYNNVMGIGRPGEKDSLDPSIFMDDLLGPTYIKAAPSNNMLNLMLLMSMIKRRKPRLCGVNCYDAKEFKKKLKELSNINSTNMYELKEENTDKAKSKSRISLLPHHNILPDIRAKSHQKNNTSHVPATKKHFSKHLDEMPSVKRHYKKHNKTMNNTKTKKTSNRKKSSRKNGQKKKSYKKHKYKR